MRPGDLRRAIPSVDRLLQSDAFAPLLAAEPRTLVLLALQQVQAELRTMIAAGGDAGAEVTSPQWYADRAAAVLSRIRAPSLRRVINATGVILHTNLGRAPLAEPARDAVEHVSRGYSNLEYDLEHGARGSRYVHCAELLVRLTGAEAALVVNNNAAALVLVLNTLGLGREVVISRGELVEIGGSFRVPDILARSGAVMREVGSTNRTHAGDYRAALGEQTAIILKVHPSNYRIEGFTSDVALEDLEPLARETNAALVHDLGSGLLVEATRLGLPYEPTPMDSLRAGADVVTMSGDKLLGGPQAGIILGRRDLIDRMRRNPLCRALRVDRMTLAALEATLSLYLDPDRARREIPVLRMLSQSEAEVADRANALVAALLQHGIAADTARADSAVGGGAFPAASLPTHVVRVTVPAPARLDRELRAQDPPIVARVADDRLIMDLRTVQPEEEATLLRTLLTLLT